MSKRTNFTTITPLPAGITRGAQNGSLCAQTSANSYTESVMATLRNHFEMIDLNPLVIERHKSKPPPHADKEEYHATWYQITDKIQYMPGAKSSVSYFGCFHDLADGLQTHVYAPAGLEIRGRWTLGGSLPGEPVQPVEIGLGIPRTGLWLREDVDMKCNIILTSFVRKTLKKSHAHLVDRLLEKAQIQEAAAQNERIEQNGQIEQWRRTAGSDISSMSRPQSTISQSFTGMSNDSTPSFMSQSTMASSNQKPLPQFPLEQQNQLPQHPSGHPSPPAQFPLGQHGPVYQAYASAQQYQPEQTYGQHSAPISYAQKAQDHYSGRGYAPAPAPVELPAEYTGQQNGPAELA
jgi:hypothetical protein